MTRSSKASGVLLGSGTAWLIKHVKLQPQKTQFCLTGEDKNVTGVFFFLTAYIINHEWFFFLPLRCNTSARTFRKQQQNNLLTYSCYHFCFQCILQLSWRLCDDFFVNFISWLNNILNLDKCCHGYLHFYVVQLAKASGIYTQPWTYALKTLKLKAEEQKVLTKDHLEPP